MFILKGGYYETFLKVRGNSYIEDGLKIILRYFDYFSRELGGRKTIFEFLKKIKIFQQNFSKKFFNEIFQQNFSKKFFQQIFSTKIFNKIFQNFQQNFQQNFSTKFFNKIFSVNFFN